jgi:hypothetical protein
MAKNENEKNEDETPAAEAKADGGGQIVSADAFREIQREERTITVEGVPGSIRIRGLSTGQTDAINAELGEGASEFLLMATIAHAGIIEPDGITLDDLLEKSPSIVLQIGGEVATISGMNEAAVKAVEKSVGKG